MDYKEKYEQAIETIKKIKAANKDNKQLVDFIEYKYPELKESEDERIRKALILYIKTNVSAILGWRKEELIAWLEKQEKQKTAWSEEDESMHDYLLGELYASLIDYSGASLEDMSKTSDWLKSIKQRMKGETK